MSITGRFEADFQSFYSAVDRADAKLQDFQSGAGRVETALNRMVDSFSGRKLIQDATLATEAIERIGGVANLTRNELQSLARTASEAVVKMNAMGIDVPPKIRTLANELNRAGDATSGVGKNAQTAAAGAAVLADGLSHVKKEGGETQKVFEDIGSKLIAAFAVERVAEFVLEIGKAEQALLRLSKETQIDVEDLQTLTAATQSYGLSNEELGKALFNVSKGLASGDDSIVRGLAAAGISLDQVRDKHGKELFLEIEKGLSTLKGSLRDSAAADIFGQKLGSAMAGFANEAQEAVDKADKLNTKISKESAQALADYADQIELAQKNLLALASNIEGPVAAGFNTLVTTAQKGAGWWKTFSANLIDTATHYTPLIADTHRLADLIDQQARTEQTAATASAQHSEQKAAAITAETQAVRFLTTLRKDSEKELAPYQRATLEALRDMGQLNQQNAAAIGVSAGQFKQYTENVKQAEAATKSLTAASIEQGAQLAKIHSDIQEELTKQTGTQTEIELAEIKKREDAEILSINKRRDALKASLEQSHADSKENLDKIDADAAKSTADVKSSFDKLRDGVGVDWNEIRSHSQEALTDIADRAMKTLIAALASNAPRAEIDKLTDAYRQAAVAATAMGQQAAAAAGKGTAVTQTWNDKLKEQDDLYEKLKKDREAESFSFQLTAANFDQYSGPGDVSKSGIFNLLKQGFSLQNAIDVLRAEKRGVALDLSKWPEDVRGPRVPGFAGGVQDFAGGKAIVGEDGPELLDLPGGSNVIPLRGRTMAGMGGVRVFAPVYVSGVFDPFARRSLSNAVGDDIMRRVLAMRTA